MTNGLQINLDALFGGSMSWKNIGARRKEVSGKTGIDGATWSRVKAGKEGFGPESAKKAAKIAGVEPVNLYVSSQIRAARKRREAGEIDDATTARIVGKILGGLKEFPGASVDEDVARGLTELAAEASEGATKSDHANQMARLGRDSGGLPLKNRQGTTKEKSVPGIYGKLGRDVDGTARKRRVM